MSIANKAADGAEAARETAYQAGERISEARKAASEKLHEGATYTRQHAGEALDAAQGLAKSAGRYARENPGQAILIGLAGLLVASLFFRRR